MAIWNRKPSKGLIIHTDQGSQYISDKYLKVLSTWGIKPSMSRRGNCWDNAVAESFFASLKKNAFWIRITKHKTKPWIISAGTIMIGCIVRLIMDSPVEYEQAYKNRISPLKANNKPLCTK